MTTVVNSIGTARTVTRISHSKSSMVNPTSEWGRPIIVASRGTDVEYRCGDCNAGWVGPIGDYCQWCHSRWLWGVESERKRLLFPEWLSWGDRYFECDDITRKVWAQSRGFIGDFAAKWERELFDSVVDGTITGQDQSQALKRYARWKTHSPKHEG